MKTKNIVAINTKFYNDLVPKAKDPANLVGWSEETQKLRLDVIMAGLEGSDMSTHTLLDVGCGMGAFYQRLKQQLPTSQVLYTGWDINEKFLLRCGLLRWNYEQPKFINQNILSLPTFHQDFRVPYDWVIACGTFALKKVFTMRLLHKAIRNMWNMSRNGVIFSFMSSLYSRKEILSHPEIGYHDPLELFKFCKKLTPHVVLRHDYLPWDATIYMYKNQLKDRSVGRMRAAKD